MKKIVLALALMMATMTVAAENILYFTYSQAARTVACLNNQDELMIYCGYENELPTYVLINEVWAEQISSSFYEIWLYGYDAYTGEEIFMPIDLECIYLMQNRNIYSAAQYLRFKYTHHRPTFAWAMPPYNPFVRAPRPGIYYYTYHYDIHRPGWHYKHYPHMHYHPYYLRHPSHPAPMPPKPFTPGHSYPGYQVDPNGGYHYTEPLVGHITTSRSKVQVQNDPTQRSGNRVTSERGSGTITTTDRATGSRNTSPAPSRTGEVRNDNNSNRGTGTTSRSGVSTDNSNNRGTGTSSRSGISTNNSNNRGTGTTSRSGISTNNSSSRGTGTTSRTSSTKDDGSTNNRSGVSSNNSNNRGNSSSSRTTSTKESSSSLTSTGTTNSSNRGSGTSSRTSNTKESDNSTDRSSATSSRGSSNTNRSGSTTNNSSSRGSSNNRNKN